MMNIDQFIKRKRAPVIIITIMYFVFGMIFGKFVNGRNQAVSQLSRKK